MKRPSKVRVNGETFRIRYRTFTEKEGNVGTCLHKDSVLEIATGQTPFNTRDTVLHEIMHALLVKQGHTGKCFESVTEERYVNALATGVIGVLHDNPELAAWLIHRKETA